VCHQPCEQRSLVGIARLPSLTAVAVNVGATAAEIEEPLTLPDPRRLDRYEVAAGVVVPTLPEVATTMHRSRTP
jgi:hypothetical protein